MKNRIGELRRERGLTLKKMGELLNIRDNTLSQYETGKREPQLGLLIEIANFFDVSLEYLICKTDKRDYPIKSDNDSIALLSKLESNGLHYDNISKSTLMDLSFWVINNQEFLQRQHPQLYTQAMKFVRYTESEIKMISRYSEIRKKESDSLNKIINILEQEEDFYTASSNDVLEFINQSKRIGYDSTKAVIELMKNLPSAN